MLENALQALLIEDNPADALLLRAALETDRLHVFTLVEAERLADGLALLARQAFDIVLLDLNLPDSQGLQTFEQVHAQAPDVPVIVFSGNTDEQEAIQSVRTGAQDYLVKCPAAWEMASRTIRHAIERHKLGKSLQESEIRFRALIENAPGAVTLIGADGRLKFASTSTQRVMGYRPEEVLGQDPAALTHPEDLPALLETLNDLIQHPGEVRLAQYRFRHQDGSWRWVESAISNLLHEPSVNGIAFNFQDITGRKQAEENLRKNEALLSEAQRIGRIGHWEWTAPAEDLLCSEELLRILEIPREGPFIPRSAIIQLIDPGEAQRLRTLDAKAFGDRTSLGYEFRVTLSGNRRRWLHQQAQVFYDDAGHPVRMIGIIQDITDRKLAEEAVRRSSEQLAAVVDIEHALATSLNQEVIFNALKDGIRRLFPDAATLFISSFDAERKVIQAVYGLHDGEPVEVENLPEIPLAPVGQGTQSQVIHTRQPLIIASDLEKSFHGKVMVHIGSHDHDTQSAIYVPMLAQEEVLGVIQLQSYISNRFGEEDIRALSLVANTAAVSIQNARLYEMAQTEIAERKRAEELLRQSETQYRYLFENNPHPMWAYDLQSMQFVAVNDAAVDKYGYSRAEFLSMTIVDIRPAEDVERLVENVRSPRPALQHSGEWRHRLKDGTLIDVEISSHTLEVGGRQSALVVAQDITERKKARVALAESEQRLKSLITSAMDAIITIDQELRIILFNQAAEKMFRIPASEALGQPLSLFVPQRFHGLHQSLMYGLSNGKASGEPPGKIFSIFGLRANGEEFPAEAAISYVESQGEKLYTAVLRDITKRKKAEAALAESEKAMRLLVHNLHAGIVVHAPDTHILLANEQASKLLGLNTDQITGKTASDPTWCFLHEDGTPMSLEEYPVMQVLATHAPLKDLIVGIQPSRGCSNEQEPVWVLANAFPEFGLDGQLSQVVVTFIDITQRRQMEEALRKSEERYRTVANFNYDWEYWIDPNHQFVYTSPSCERLTGYRPEEFRADAQLLEKIVHPQDLLALRAHLEAEFQQEGATAIDFRIITAGGETRWVNHVCQAVYGTDEQWLGRRASNRDITERKQAEQQVQALQEFTLATIDALSAHICVLDENGIILSVNRAWRDFADGNPPVPATYFVGDNYLSVCDRVQGEEREQAAAVAQGIRAVMNAEANHFQMEYPCHSPQENRWFIVRVTRFFAQDHFARIVIAHENITERKRIEESLRQSEARFATIFRANPAAIAITHFDSNQLVDVNDTWQKMTGYTLKEVLERTPYEMDLWPQPDQREQMVKAVKERGKARCEIQLRQKSGEIRELLMEAEVIALADTHYLLTMAQDITEQKQYETGLHKRAAQLELINIVGQKIAGVLEIQGVLDLAAHLVNEAFGYYHVALFLFEEEQNHFVMKAKSGQFARYFPDNHRVFLGDGMVGYVGQCGKMLLSNDVRKEAHYMNYFPELLSTVSELSLPIQVGGTVVGVLDVQSPQPEAFNDDDVMVLGILADQIAVALENAHLYEAIRNELAKRQQVEEELRKHRDHLEELVRERTAEVQDLYENAPTGYHSLDAEGRFLMINQTELNWLGYSREEVLGRPFTGFITPDSLAVFRDNFPVFKQLGKVRDLEFEMVRKDGSALPVVVGATAIYDEHGQYMMSRSTVFDNTERRKTEIALRESQANLQNFLDTASDLIQSLNEEGKYLYVNNAWCDTLGYTPEEAWQLSMPDVVDPAYHGHCLEIIRNLAAFGRPQKVEVVFRTKQGEAVIVDGSVSSRKDKDGHVITNGIFRNITLRKQAEEALRASEERMNYLLSKTPALIFTAEPSPKFPITFISDSVRNTLGYAPQQYLEDPGFWARIVHADDLPGEHLAIQTLFEQGHAVWESRMLHSDGQYQWMSTGSSLLRNESGQPVEIIGYSVNIEDQKKAQDALRESEETYRALFEAANDAIFLIDLDSNFVRLNPRCPELLGFDCVEEMIGRKSTEFVAPYQAEDARQHLVHLLAGEKVSFYERTFVRKNGTKIEAEVNLSLIRDNLGNPKFIQSVVRDITQRKQAEEALRRANLEMEQAMRMKDEFLASMSHELRTPLTGILGLSEALQIPSYGTLNEKQLKAVRNIEASGRHLLELINDILDLSKIEAGKLELQFEPCSLGDVCQASLQLTKGMAQKKHLNVSLSMHPASIRVRADQRRLKQMLVNLLSNAIKFTPENGSVGLDVAGAAGDPLIRITVWDTGIGIKTEDVERLFQPFVQLDSSLARQYTGSGLGLSLVKRMMELHGGQIEVRSTPGEGSRFTLVFPRLPEEATQPVPYRGAGLASPTILPLAHLSAPPVAMVVDDNEVNVETIAGFLESQQFQVKVAFSGPEFLEQVASVRPNIVLLDIQMPGIDGLEVIRRLRAYADPKIAAVPVIAITALAMPGDRERCLAAGANEYMSKPVGLRELARVITRLL